MKSPLEQVSELEDLLRQLHKVDSKLISGQIILAYRDVNSIIAKLEATKRQIIDDDKKQNTKPV